MIGGNSFGLVVEIFTLLSISVGVIAFFIGLRQYHRQNHLNVFSHYTQRYGDIMESFPTEARSIRLDSNSELPPESEETTLAVLRYLNLCSEEYYLWRRGFLDKEIWGIWSEELERMLRSNLVRREWPKLKREFDSYTEFQEYLEALQRAS